MNIPAWLTTSSTGQGGSVLLGLIAGLASGTMTWQHAIPVGVLGIALILFPQNTGVAQALQTAAADAVAAAPTAVADYKQIALAFQAGMVHRDSMVPPAANANLPAAQQLPTPPTPAPLLGSPSMATQANAPAQWANPAT